MSSANPRATAAKLLERVIYGGESFGALQDTESGSDPLVRDLCFGSLRWHPRLSAVLEQLLTKSLKRKDKDVECLLRVGLYQILYQNTPEYAAVNETVSAVKALRKSWAIKFVNGVLRTFLRRKESMLHAADQEPSARFAMPEWLLESLRDAWPQRWENVLESCNQRAPMTLRVNLSRQSREDCLKRFEEAGIASTPHPLIPSALVLEQPCHVFDLPGFADGLVSVQDAAAQLAAGLLGCESGMRVLDACAAPGGKTGHLLEMQGDISLLAVEQVDARLTRIKQNLSRLELEAELVQGDVSKPDGWAEGGFDRILLDAPCSGTGVIRRHPDIKVLRWEEDIARLQQTQHELLASCWQMLRPGGRLVYATCSILPAENAEVVKQFVEAQSDAVHLPIDAVWGEAQPFGRQIFPGDDQMDGFYYAVLEKRA